MAKGIPCVVLASGPRPGIDWKQFDALLGKFDPGPQKEVDKEYRVFFKVAGTQDGGNGGGGEPGGKEMFPVLGVGRRAAWDFQQYPDNPDWNKRFPPITRFEVCLDFKDISHASEYLRTAPLGKLISTSFTTVMIVTLSRRLT